MDQKGMGTARQVRVVLDQAEGAVLLGWHLWVCEFAALSFRLRAVVAACKRWFAAPRSG
jgi:hypothetical protein